jgi:hypothetical protein
MNAHRALADLVRLMGPTCKECGAAQGTVHDDACAVSFVQRGLEEWDEKQLSEVLALRNEVERLQLRNDYLERYARDTREAYWDRIRARARQRAGL